MSRLLLALLLISQLSLAQDITELEHAVAEAQALSIKQPLLALATQKELLAKIDEKTTPQLKLQVYAQLSNTLANMSHYPESLEQAELGLALFNSLNAPESLKAEAFELQRGKATAFIFLGNEKGALDILEQLETEAKQQNKNELLSGIYFQKGLLFSNSRRSIDALETLSKAWALAGPNDLDGQGDMFHLIGNAYQTSGESDRAIAMHEAAIEELKALHLPQRLALVAYAVGTIHLNREQYAEAVNWFTQARNWAKEVNDVIGEAFNSLQLATALIKKGDWANAGKALDACEKTFAQNGFMPQQILLELARAEISLAQNKPQRALGSVIAAETRFSPRDVPPPIKRKMWQMKANILTQLERHDQAADVALKLQELPAEEGPSGAPLSEQDKQRLAAIAAQLDQQMATFKQQKTQRSASLATDQQQQQMLQWIIIGGGSILVIGFFVWLVRRRH